MEQGGSSKQQAINQRGRRQGVVRQAGHSGQEVEGRGDVGVQPTQNTPSVLDLTEPQAPVSAPTPAAETEATNPWLKPTMSSFKDINLVEEVDLSEEIILEFESLIVGGGTTNASAGGAQPSGDGCAR
ncbi:hypothetical protein P8452_42492 [Trifolium repens]|nr:hypothetical protein P8452_42492 [Trifolium repens]